MAEQKRGQDVTAGADRRDDVGQNGVYPATGPYPEGEVEILTPGELNGPHDENDTADDQPDSDALGG
jgi:hypothetical protein